MGTGLGGGRVWGLTAVVLAAAACHEPGQVRQVEATAVFDKQALDFGGVPVGEWRELEVTVQNAGYVPFTASEALKLTGNSSFQVELEGGGKVLSGEKRQVRVRFHPLRQGALTEEVKVLTDAEHQPGEPLHIRGEGTPTQLHVYPPLLDYQTLEVESDRTLVVTVENTVDLPLTLSVAGRSGDEFTSDTLTVAPNATQQVSARYLPRGLGDSAAQLNIRSCEDCTPTAVELAGKSVKSALVFDPEPVPFENIPVHEKTRSHTRATNITWRPVQLGQASTSDRSFSPLTDLGNQVLQPGASVDLEMEFAARYSGPSTGVLRLDYQSDRAHATEVLLDARGGRPQLALAPVALDFGEIPVGSKVEKTVRLSNAGTTGQVHLQGITGTAGAEQFNLSAPFRGKTVYAYSGGAWPAYKVPDLAIAPGNDFLDVKVYFEPTVAGELQGTITFASDDLFNPERTISVTGRARSSGPCAFRLRPAQGIDFGDVPVGSGAVLGFRFENAGRTECAVKNIHVSEDGKGVFFMPGGPITGGTVSADTAFSAQVAFKSGAEGSFHGTLEIQVNDPDHPVVSVPLTAVALRTCLTAAPGFVDFGAVRFDCQPATHHTYVANQCPWPIQVDGVRLGAGTGEEFSLASAPVLPRTLDPGQGFELEVGFARAVLGQHYNPLYIQAHGEPTPLLVPVLGETNHEGIETERFVQGTDSQLDVLFVVSNTTTMGPYQDKLKEAIPAWIQRAKDAGVDMRVGVTTTGLVTRGLQCGGGANGGEAGRLFPADNSRARVVSNQSPTAVADIQADVGVGLCHNLVQGLEAMRQALTSPLVDRSDDPFTPLPNDGNLGLLRAAARLAVVFLSDEDDHSGFDPISYTQLLQALKGPGSSQRTSAYAIVPVDAACRTAGPPGPRFAQVAKSTGGQVLDVCAQDYGSLLDPLAQRAAGAQRDFRLAQRPVSQAEVVVKVNGQVAAPGTWTFDARANAVVFDAAAVPPSGQTVEVRYRSICGAAP